MRPWLSPPLCAPSASIATTAATPATGERSRWRSARAVTGARRPGRSRSRSRPPAMPEGRDVAAADALSAAMKYCPWSPRLRALVSELDQVAAGHRHVLCQGRRAAAGEMVDAVELAEAILR